jgi:hypothetical protein
MLSKKPQETHRIPQSNKCRNRVRMPVPGYTSAHHLASPPSAINLRYAGRFRKILLGDLGIENGKLRMENY